VTARFEGRRALVTGGASGIGLATAELALGGGAAVALLDRREDALAEAATRLGVLGIVCDVADEEQVRRAAADAAGALEGPIDVLVNAAGIYRIAPLVDIALDEWDEVLDVNLRGTFLVAREVARGLIAAERGGAIVNVSSIAAVIADRDEPTGHYNASKAGVVALTRQMAVEWADHLIRVNAVVPGVIDTPMLRREAPESLRAYLHARVALRRLGGPDEVARAIAFLASDESSYVTGTALPVDGGVLAL